MLNPDKDIIGDLGDRRTLEPGTYNAAAAIGVTGTLKLKDNGSELHWIFKTGAALTFAAASTRWSSSIPATLKSPMPKRSNS
jgi:hypothetical protein